MVTKRPGSTGPHPYAGGVMTVEQLRELLNKFGMSFGMEPDADEALITTQLAHALVGIAEAHATRAEQAYRLAGAEPGDLTQASLMAFAGANCQNEVDELALISWRAQRLTGALTTLDFGGPSPRFPRKGETGSGDVLMGTIRLVAAALTGMTKAAHTAINPLRERGESATAGHLLSRAMTCLEKAHADIHTHRAVADLMRMSD